MASKQFWGVVVTAAFAIAITFTPMPEKWRYPVVVAAWLVMAFAGGGWLNEHRKGAALSTLGKRDKTGQLIERGVVLKNQWLEENTRPRLRTWLWDKAVDDFVRHNFTMAQYDAFRRHLVPVSQIYQIAMIAPRETKSAQFEAAKMIASKVSALESLSKEIRD
jgi:hypothetical protein